MKLVLIAVTATLLALPEASFAQLGQLQNGSCNAGANLTCPCPNGQAPTPGLGCPSSATGSNVSPCTGPQGTILADCLVGHRKDVANQKYLTPGAPPITNTTLGNTTQDTAPPPGSHRP
jgi:hypothetical protein